MSLVTVICYNSETLERLHKFLGGKINGARLDLDFEPDWGIWGNALSNVMLDGLPLTKFRVEGKTNEYLMAKRWLEGRGYKFP